MLYCIIALLHRQYEQMRVDLFYGRDFDLSSVRFVFVAIDACVNLPLCVIADALVAVLLGSCHATISQETFVSHHEDLPHAAVSFQPFNNRTSANIGQLIVAHKDFPQAFESAEAQAQRLNVGIPQLLQGEV